MRHLHFLAAAALAAALGVAPVSAQPMARGPHQLNITTCDPQLNPTMGFAPGYYYGRHWYWRDVYGYDYYEWPYRNASPTLNISYTNETNKTMTTIDFGLLGGRGIVAEVRDVGTFSPGVRIDHAFGLDPALFPLSAATVRCVPLFIKYADGTKWVNPHLPARRRRQLYASPQP
jgi:hypothetical protein